MIFSRSLYRSIHLLNVQFFSNAAHFNSCYFYLYQMQTYTMHSKQTKDEKRERESEKKEREREKEREGERESEWENELKNRLKLVFRFRALLYQCLLFTCTFLLFSSHLGCVLFEPNENDCMARRLAYNFFLYSFSSISLFALRYCLYDHLPNGCSCFSSK